MHLHTVSAFDWSDANKSRGREDVIILTKVGIHSEIIPTSDFFFPIKYGKLWSCTEM